MSSARDNIVAEFDTYMVDSTRTRLDLIEKKGKTECRSADPRSKLLRQHDDDWSLGDWVSSSYQVGICLLIAHKLSNQRSQ